MQWPERWERTPAHRRTMSRYRQLSFAVSRDELILELERSGASNVVISSNLPLLANGLPSGNAPEPADPGIAVYWSKDGEQHELACDQWFLTAENIRALLMAVQAFRQLERCGATEIVKRAYQAFAALPPSSDEPKQKTCWEVLGVPEFANEATVRSAYLLKIRKAHPDRGGSVEETQKLNAAYAEALKVLETQ